GHQGALGAIDHLGAARLDRLGGHLFYVLALDQHLVAAACLVPARVEQAEIPEQNLRHRRSPFRRRKPTLAVALALESPARCRAWCVARCGAPSPRRICGAAATPSPWCDPCSAASRSCGGR